MSIVYFTDFLSAFAACATVCLAVMELISRNKVKKATDAIEIYADYLHTIQYMNYAIKSLENLLKRFDSIDKVEMSSYAKTHVVNDAMFNLIDKIEKNSICNMNYSSKKGNAGKENSKIILSFCSEATNLLVSINTIYQALIDNKDVTVKIKSKFNDVLAYYENMQPSVTKTSDLLSENLVSTENEKTNRYIFVLIALSVFLLLIYVL